MKRFFSNLGLAVLTFLGLVAMTGNALLEDTPFFQGIVIFAGLYLCVTAGGKLAYRLAAHLPDEEV